MSDENKLDNDTIIENDTAVESEEIEETVDISELESLQNEKNELEDQNLRLQAEIQNIQRRSRKNREEATKFRAQNLAIELIPALDNLERVLDVETTSEESENIKKGVEMTLLSIEQAFTSQSIEIIQPEVGTAFDPNIHEATAMVEAEEGQESSVIAYVMQKGYSLNGRILRPAMVAVTQ